MSVKSISNSNIITYSKETIKKINELKIQDLQQQLENLKKNKKHYDYKEYRKLYMKIHQCIKWCKDEIEKLKSTEDL